MSNVPVGSHEYGPKGAKRGHFFMKITPMLETVSTLLMGFPEYGLTNALNFRWGFPLLATPTGCKKGVFIQRNDANAKTLSNLSERFSEYGMTNDIHFCGGFPSQQLPRGAKKGAFIYGYGE